MSPWRTVTMIAGFKSQSSLKFGVCIFGVQCVIYYSFLDLVQLWVEAWETSCWLELLCVSRSYEPQSYALVSVLSSEHLLSKHGHFCSLSGLCEGAIIMVACERAFSLPSEAPVLGDIWGEGGTVRSANRVNCKWHYCFSAVWNNLQTF